jgi:hypothetical protein
MPKRQHSNDSGQAKSGVSLRINNPFKLLNLFILYGGKISCSLDPSRKGCPAMSVMRTCIAKSGPSVDLFITTFASI